jgi:predicted small lipoprotein YifL
VRESAVALAAVLALLACGVKAPPQPPGADVSSAQPERSSGDAGAESKGGGPPPPPDAGTK